MGEGTWVQASEHFLASKSPAVKLSRGPAPENVSCWLTRTWDAARSRRAPSDCLISAARLMSPPISLVQKIGLHPSLRSASDLDSRSEPLLSDLNIRADALRVREGKKLNDADRLVIDRLDAPAL
jgi:hypothetical protein